MRFNAVLTNRLSFRAGNSNCSFSFYACSCFNLMSVKMASHVTLQKFSSCLCKTSHSIHAHCTAASINALGMRKNKDGENQIFSLFRYCFVATWHFYSACMAHIFRKSLRNSKLNNFMLPNGVHNLCICAFG